MGESPYDSHGASSKPGSRKAAMAAKAKIKEDAKKPAAKAPAKAPPKTSTKAPTRPKTRPAPSPRRLIGVGGGGRVTMPDRYEEMRNMAQGGLVSKKGK